MKSFIVKLNWFIIFSIKHGLRVMITFSCIYHRFIGGVFETAAFNAVTSILMALYPDKVASVMSWTQMFFGFGYMMGT